MLVISLILPIASAQFGTFRIHSTIDLGENGITDPIDIAMNSTSTTIGDIFVTDGTTNVIAHYRPDGTKVGNITPNAGTFTNMGPIWINTTDSNTTTNNTAVFFVGDRQTERVFVLNFTGGNLSSFVQGNGLSVSDAMTSPFGQGDVTFLKILAQTDAEAVDVTLTGVESNSLTPEASCGEDFFGIATNSSRGDQNMYFFTSDNPEILCQVDNNGAKIDSIDLAALGIAAPRGLEVRERNGTATTFWIIDTATDQLFRITSDEISTSITAPTSNQTSVQLLREINLSSGVQTAGTSAFATLITNQTGEFKNITDGRYGSPLALRGVTNTLENASFIWIDDMFTYAGFNQTVGYQVMVNDTLGSTNISVISTFRANSHVITEASGVRSISQINRDGFPNVTITFNRSATTNFDMLMPSIARNATFSGCNFEAEFAGRIRTTNQTMDNTSTAIQFCNISFFDAKINTTGTFKLSASIRFSPVSPRNLPVIIGALGILTFIVVYAVRIIRKK